ncbi:hypothetical protein HDU97_006580 [Phlyctochytrium planicorne]|nr:hypothetical protein HDU97_006580 [Phlyctochytrium planicorne]
MLVDWAYNKKYKWYLEFFIKVGASVLSLFLKVIANLSIPSKSKSLEGQQVNVTTQAFDASLIPSPGRYNFLVPSLEPGRYQFWRLYFDPQNSSNFDSRVTHNLHVDDASMVWPNFLPASTATPSPNGNDSPGNNGNTITVNIRVVIVVMGILLLAAITIVVLAYLNIRKNQYIFKRSRGNNSASGDRRWSATSGAAAADLDALGKKSPVEGTMENLTTGGFLPREVTISSDVSSVEPKPSSARIPESPGLGSAKLPSTLPDASQYPSLTRSQTSASGFVDGGGYAAAANYFNTESQHGNDSQWISASYHRSSSSSHRRSYRAPSIVSRISGHTPSYYASTTNPNPSDGHSVISRLSQKKIFQDFASEHDTDSEDGVGIVVAGPGEEVDPITGDIVPKRSTALSRLRSPSLRSRKSTISGRAPESVGYGSDNNASKSPSNIGGRKRSISQPIPSTLLKDSPFLSATTAAGSSQLFANLDASPPRPPSTTVYPPAPSNLDGHLGTFTFERVHGGLDDTSLSVPTGSGVDDDESFESDDAWRMEGEDEEERIERESREKEIDRSSIVAAEFCTSP